MEGFVQLHLKGWLRVRVPVGISFLLFLEREVSKVPFFFFFLGISLCFAHFGEKTSE